VATAFTSVAAYDNPEQKKKKKQLLGLPDFRHFKEIMVSYFTFVLLFKYLGRRSCNVRKNGE
jgi:hypothetical protein